MSASVRRIAVLGRGMVGWGGGVDLLRIMLNGLCAMTAPRPQLTLLLPQLSWGRRLRHRLRAVRRQFRDGLRGARTPSPPAQGLSQDRLHEAFADYASQVTLRLGDGGRRGLARALRAADAQLVLPCMDSPGAGFPLPWIGYIYDFQHRHLPQLFSARERERRDAGFGALMAEAPAIVVTSRAVQADAERFYPQRRAAVIALPFAPSLRADLLTADPQRVRDRHGIPGRYFIICNQFWVHKDHRTAFLALALLLEQSADAGDVALVCTGSLEDHRAPGHMDTLRALLAERQIAARVFLLGYVPKIEQIALVRGALAVIQPTRFEGAPGGGASNDAASLGVPLILSDIPVNREVDAPAVVYFPPGDPAALAARMDAALRGQRPAPSPEALKALAQGRLARLAAAFETAIAAARQRAD